MRSTDTHVVRTMRMRMCVASTYMPMDMHMHMGMDMGMGMGMVMGMGMDMSQVAAMACIHVAGHVAAASHRRLARPRAIRAGRTHIAPPIVCSHAGAPDSVSHHHHAPMDGTAIATMHPHEAWTVTPGAGSPAVVIETSTEGEAHLDQSCRLLCSMLHAIAHVRPMRSHASWHTRVLCDV